MTDPKRLRELAEKATKGPWQVDGTGTVICDCPAEFQNTVIAPNDDGPARDRENAQYIAAANPQAILALLDRLDSAREVMTRIAEEIDEEPTERPTGDCMYCSYGPVQNEVGHDDGCPARMCRAWLDANGEGK